MPDGDLTPLAEGAAAAHEMFVSYVAAGFTPSQALYLVGVAIASAMPKPEAPDG